MQGQLDDQDVVMQESPTQVEKVFVDIRRWLKDEGGSEVKLPTLDRCSNIGDSSQRREESCFSLGPGDSWYLFVGRIVSYKLLPPHCCHASAILRLCYCHACCHTPALLLPRSSSTTATSKLSYRHAWCHIPLHSHLCCHRLHSFTAANPS